MGTLCTDLLPTSYAGYVGSVRGGRSRSQSRYQKRSRKQNTGSAYNSIAHDLVSSRKA